MLAPSALPLIFFLFFLSFRWLDLTSHVIGRQDFFQFLSFCLSFLLMISFHFIFSLCFLYSPLSNPPHIPLDLVTGNLFSPHQPSQSSRRTNSQKKGGEKKEVEFTIHNTTRSRIYIIIPIFFSLSCFFLFTFFLCRKFRRPGPCKSLEGYKFRRRR